MACVSTLSKFCTYIMPNNQRKNIEKKNFLTKSGSFDREPALLTVSSTKCTHRMCYDLTELAIIRDVQARPLIRYGLRHYGSRQILC